jgi:hypothetical protein
MLSNSNLKTWGAFIVTFASIQIAAASTGFSPQGSEQIQFPVSKSGNNCISSALLTIDYSNLKLNIKETAVGGSCPTIDPNGKTYEIHKINLSKDEVRSGIEVTSAAGQDEQTNDIVVVDDLRRVTDLRPIDSLVSLSVNSNGRLVRWYLDK